MYLGLDMAWRENITHLTVESDSKILVDMITDNCKFSGIIPTLVRRIRKFLNLSWTVQVNHTLREGNRNVDWLANYNILMDSMNFNLLETPPNELRSLLFDDLSVTCMPRNVMLVFFSFLGFAHFCTKKKIKFLIYIFVTFVQILFLE